MSLLDYLTTPAAAALGRSNATFVLSGVRFPVHRQFVSACCSTLAELLQEYATAEELVLFPTPTPPSTPPPSNRSGSGRSSGIEVPALPAGGNACKSLPALGEEVPACMPELVVPVLHLAQVLRRPRVRVKVFGGTLSRSPPRAATNSAFGMDG